MKKIKVSHQGTYNFQNLWNETWVTADYEYVKDFFFAMLDVSKITAERRK